jgi:hypothetical protein
VRAAARMDPMRRRIENRRSSRRLGSEAARLLARCWRAWPTTEEVGAGERGRGRPRRRQGGRAGAHGHGGVVGKGEGAGTREVHGGGRVGASGCCGRSRGAGRGSCRRLKKVAGGWDTWSRRLGRQGGWSLAARAGRNGCSGRCGHGGTSRARAGHWTCSHLVMAGEGSRPRDGLGLRVGPGGTGGRRRWGRGRAA